VIPTSGNVQGEERQLDAPNRGTPWGRDLDDVSSLETAAEYLKAPVEKL